MLYLVSKKSLALNCMRKFATNFHYEVIKVSDRNLTVGDIYNSDNFVYCDKRNSVYSNGYTISSPNEIENTLKAVNNYKVSKRLNKLKMIL